MDINRNAAAIVTNRNGPIHVNSHVNLIAKPGEMFVDGVVQHFEDAMVQAPLIGVADVHARALADSFQPLQFIDLGGVVLLQRVWLCGLNFVFHENRLFQHKSVRKTAILSCPKSRQNFRKIPLNRQLLFRGKNPQNHNELGVLALSGQISGVHSDSGDFPGSPSVKARS
jgi:hypothetical protein